MDWVLLRPWGVTSRFQSIFDSSFALDAPREFLASGFELSFVFGC